MPGYIDSSPNVAAAKASVNIEAWTEETIESLRTVRISSASFSSTRITRGASAPLEISLDQEQVVTDTEATTTTPTSYARRREPVRRDSMNRREALLKGKEGSRRRQKWENDRLLGNPWAEPPTSADWEIRPTYRSHTVPYFLAPMWDERQAQAKNLLAQQTKRAASLQASGGACVPRELKEKLKRSKGAKSLLQDLEEEVRKFVKSWEEKHEAPADDGLDDVHSSDEEEIVFVGRNGKMRDDKPRDSSKALEKLVFESPVSDQGAAFGRWLVHSIAAYYDLNTWSVTKGNPARREAYVGIANIHMKTGRSTSAGQELPRPLWSMI